MKFRIHYELPDGTEDSVIISARTVAEIRQEAEKELLLRNGQNEWAEEIEELQ